MAWWIPQLSFFHPKYFGLTTSKVKFFFFFFRQGTYIWLQMTAVE